MPLSLSLALVAASAACLTLARNLHGHARISPKRHPKTSTPVAVTATCAAVGAQCALAAPSWGAAQVGGGACLLRRLRLGSMTVR